MKTIKPDGYQKLVFGVLLACGAAGAQADQTLSTNGLPVGGSNDIFLTVWDQPAATSYSVDLGVSMPTFEAEVASGNITWNLDSVFQSFAATGDNLIWNIAGVNAVTKTTTADSVLQSYGYGEISQSFTSLTVAYATMAGMQALVGGEINNLYAYGSQVVTNTNDPAYFASAGWGVSQGVGSSIDSTTTSGTTTFNALFPQSVNKLGVIFLNAPGGTVKSTTTVVDTIPVGYFSLNTSNDTLVWSATAPASAVPVPGAIWLFLGGVMSMLGLQKRKIA